LKRYRNEEGSSVRQLIKSFTTETQQSAGSLPWARPELRRLAAGAAENSGHAGNDGTTNLS
jgi:hypothetical protein